MFLAQSGPPENILDIQYFHRDYALPILSYSLVLSYFRI